MKLLSKRQRRIYQFICRFCSDHQGIPPTIREIQEGLQVSSTSVVAYHLEQLKKRGLLEMVGSQKWQVAGSMWLPPHEKATPSEAHCLGIVTLDKKRYRHYLVPIEEPQPSYASLLARSFPELFIAGELGASRTTLVKSLSARS